MSRTLKIILLAAAATLIFLIVSLLPPLHHHFRPKEMFVAEQVAQDLIRTTNSALLTSVEPALKKDLQAFLSCPAKLESVGPTVFQKGQAQFRITLINATNRLALEVQWEPKQKKFSTVDYWYPAPPPTLTHPE